MDGREMCDKLSSAHAYLRLKPDQTWDTIPQKLLNDLGQLVKANSIEGVKKSSVVVVYTPWKNLMKTGEMDVGQVSFRDHSLVKKITVEKDNQIVRRLEKTKKESFPDLALEKLEMEKERRKILKEAANQKEKEKLQLERQRREEAEKRSYEPLFVPSNMRSNSQNTNDVKDINEWEEDFM
ncbi:8387_t:CDS:2 [Ambispora gerdemannii]|uniref:8387_t:CDS:1 n=1 Tax=Ambispora gerdemannii TaxID=144530 RepID=A0A9N8YSN0_9GLOM|nr:8387_t:CDS:2 [Ambispora gerdemannii]